MKPSHILLVVLVICAITMMGFVGVSAYTEGEITKEVLVLFGGLMTTVVTQVLSVLNGRKTLAVSQQTDEKADKLLNGSLQGKISTLDQRVGNIEQQLVKILNKLS